jgi:peptidoglycan hydrolase-like protein with peptidoglycan-binding domain
VAAVDPRRPSPEELRLAALERVENALLRTPGARRQVQEELLALGHAPGRPDGRFGPGTRAAIGSFQAASALEVTGYADKPTLVALEREAARLAPPIEEAATVAQPRPSRLRPNAQAVAAPPQPPPVAVAAPPQAAGVPGGTMGTCTAAGGASWANERHLTYDQCRKVGGSFTPF